MNEPGCLYVVGTPIGNLEDITFRAVRLLKEVGIIAAEDTRVTAKLTSRYGINTKTISIGGKATRRNISYVVDALVGGADVAIVTDAGTPSISDPGLELVLRARNLGIKISPIPGPSALAAAVSVTALSGDGIRFLGFLPRDGRKRKDIISSLRTERALSVLYESPNRLGKTLFEISEVCQKDRKGSVLRELTKIHEEIVEDTLAALALRFQKEVLGEIVVLVEGCYSEDRSELTNEELRSLILQELLAGRSVKDVAASLSQGLGLPRKKIYMSALELSLSDKNQK